MICPDCNGRGEAGCLTVMTDGEDFYDDCPTCKGEGEIEPEVHEPWCNCPYCDNERAEAGE